MKLKTLYISDLDGTLLTSDKMVTPYTTETLNKLIAEGMHFSVATARTPATVTELLETIHIKEPIVVMNGTAIYDLETKTYVDVEYIDQEIYEPLIEAIQKIGGGGFVYCIDDQQICAYHRELVNPYEIEFYEERKNKIQKLFKQEPVPMNGKVAYITIMDTKEKIDQIVAAIEHLEGLSMVAYTDVYTSAYYLEIYSHKVSKASAITKLKARYGFDHIICFGDNLNDMQMFELAEEGYAVANAVEPLKAIATEVIDSHNDNGVAKCIEAHYKKEAAF
ncbi:MAG: HAD family hydrolase [Cellulosilyticaceae bacterium]